GGADDVAGRIPRRRGVAASGLVAGAGDRAPARVEGAFDGRGEGEERPDRGRDEPGEGNGEHRHGAERGGHEQEGGAGAPAPDSSFRRRELAPRHPSPPFHPDQTAFTTATGRMGSGT